MSQDYPPLALDDLVHIMSPSPAPQASLEDSVVPLRTKSSSSPEPVQEFDTIEMRKKVAELRYVDNGNSELNPREKELAEMVLRLTGVVRPNSEQLVRQAEMISALTQQRDLLIHQAEEQRLRWNSEKDGWARMAEALIAQQAKSRSNADRDEDAERLRAAIEADNRGLRQRLNETQTRLQMLEAELTRLRPLLLMQPLVSSSSLPPPTPKPKQQQTRRRKKDAVPPTATEDEERGASDEDVPSTILDSVDTPARASHTQMTPRTKSRRPDAVNNIQPQFAFTNQHKRRSSQKTVSRGLSADARAEHLLLAARKVGKQRAGIMSGMLQQLEERERERRREDSAATAVATTPKTPKRIAPHPGYPLEGGYVYMNSPVRPGPGIHPVPVLIPAYPHHLLQTPSSSTTAASAASSAQRSTQKHDTRVQNPPTPLDSLLSAARSMMHDDEEEEEEEDGEPGKTIGTRRSRPNDMPESPVPKRRKIAARGDELIATREPPGAPTTSAPVTSTLGVTNAVVGRVKSALDVLADQAAAFSSQEQSVAQPQEQTKGKGKEKADIAETSGQVSKPRERARSRRKEPEAEVTSSATPTLRSKTPRSDSGAQQRGGPTPEVPADPGGQKSSTTDSSSETIDSISAAQADQVIQTPSKETQTSQTPQTPSTEVDNSTDATPKQISSNPTTSYSRAQSEVVTRGIHTPVVQPNPTSVHYRASSVSTSASHEESPSTAPARGRSETAPAVSQGGSENGSSGAGPATAMAKNKDLARVSGQDAPTTKRQRSPYIKWSKEEDVLLAQAVAKYGQKWDLVQKALPSRGYHQVRQRWLRKLGVFDSKPDLSSFQTAVYPSTSRVTGDSGNSEPPPNPKLGLAPLSSELAFSLLLSGRGESRPPTS
ncbi:hypothetical protein PAXINDRAFT_181363 [Paxillus involutus ATCC 200175]|uniref:Myb-like domain-containing protein n=1 Tax=Paxillus involutus ATCC 200175 TaxID=664439 RepID=A0A0C9U0S5_PAXIN|nr:hypothetical protein PAXINDRAFT_181363 [Paxillus involutus ATCC 200175]